jgi:hypothetical protein
MGKLDQALDECYARCASMGARDVSGKYKLAEGVSADEHHMEHTRHGVLCLLKWQPEAGAAMLRECLTLVEDDHA